MHDEYSEFQSVRFRIAESAAGEVREEDAPVGSEFVQLKGMFFDGALLACRRLQNPQEHSFQLEEFTDLTTQPPVPIL